MPVPVAVVLAVTTPPGPAGAMRKPLPPVAEPPLPPVTLTVRFRLVAVVNVMAGPAPPPPPPAAPVTTAAPPVSLKV